MTVEKSKVCFVISPIGEEGSDIRKMSDDFLELLVEPALQPFGFTIQRADKIASPSAITSDIIKHVQTADLCIIDLTTHNPNVFYECGRRHENGKPFIQLIKKGESLPFDVSGIRTISYDLTDPRSTLESVRAIQNFVKSIEAEGYGASSTGESLSSIAEGITRIERALNHLATEVISSKESAGQIKTLKDVLTKHPVTAFNEAFNSGDLETAIKILPRMKKLVGPTNWLRSAVLLAQAGETAGEVAIKEALSDYKNLTPSLAVEGYLGLRHYYFNRNMNEQGLIELKNAYDYLNKNLEFTNEQKAILLSYIQIFQVNTGAYEEAIQTGLEMIKFHRNAIGLGNLAHVYKELNRLKEAATYIDECINMSGVTEVELQTALDIYTRLDRKEDIKKVKEKLQVLKSVAQTSTEIARG